MGVRVVVGGGVAGARVLDRERVQVEFPAHLVDFGIGGVEQCHPHEATRPGEVVVDLALRDIRELLAVLVGGAVDEHGEKESGNFFVPECYSDTIRATLQEPRRPIFLRPAPRP